MRNGNGPDFLGIGAQKAGTTWLWENLRQHPEIWTPPVKELHYFDRAPKYPSPSRLRIKSPWQRIQNQQYRQQIKQDLPQVFQHIQQGNWQTALWLLRYRFGTYNDQWYLSLFPAQKDKVVGEITPAYSMLTAEDVEHISHLLPDLKIIFLLRNPVDRAWSYVRFKTKTQQFTETNNIDKIKQLIEQPDQIRRSDYLHTLSTWKTFFPEHNIFIGFFDEIVAHPASLLERISQFLGINSYHFHEELQLRREKIYASPEIDMPDAIKVYLYRKYHADLQNLSALVGEYANTWLEQANQILAEHAHLQQP